MTRRVLVVGTGLIGTSIGLALRDRAQVLLTDAAQGRVAVATGRGAGQPWDGRATVDLAVVAVPPRAVAGELTDLVTRGVARTYTHVASVQSHVQREVEALLPDVATVCGGHPLAGRETPGPESASADLFLGRPWVLCPSATTTEAALSDVRELAVDCGAEPEVMTPAEHDRTVALVSHLPQVAASALAALLLAAPDVVDVSGPGLQDTTRLAGSDPTLWTEVLDANAPYVAPLVRGLADELTALAAALSGGSGPAVRDLLERGRRGRALVPVKRGEHDRDFRRVAVAVSDEPGQLAGLFVAAAQAQVNVEDVRVEHLPGRPTGVIELMVHADDRDRLAGALDGAGFAVLGRS